MRIHLCVAFASCVAAFGPIDAGAADVKARRIAGPCVRAAEVRMQPIGGGPVWSNMSCLEGVVVAPAEGERLMLVATDDPEVVHVEYRASDGAVTQGRVPVDGLVHTLEAKRGAGIRIVLQAASHEGHVWLDAEDVPVQDVVRRLAETGMDIEGVEHVSRQRTTMHFDSIPVRTFVELASAVSRTPYDRGKDRFVFLDGSGWLDAAALRAGAEVSEDARRLYDSAQRALHDASRDGARARVHFAAADGTSWSGIDEWFATQPPRLRELRAKSESVAVGARVCNRRHGEDWTCNDGEFAEGLPEVAWGAVRAARVEAADCEGKGGCVRISIEQAKAFGWEGSERYSPDRSGRSVIVLAERESQRPIEVVVVEDNGALGTERVTYTYELDADVAPIELPK